MTSTEGGPERGPERLPEPYGESRYADGRYGDGRYQVARTGATGRPQDATARTSLLHAPEARSIDAGRLWSSAIATAVVAALIALVGVLIARALLQIAMLAPRSAGVLGDGSTLLLCGLAALAALAATGLAHILLLTTPQPMVFFTWIVGLVTAAATIGPLIWDVPIAERLAAAIVNLVIGLSISSLVTGAVVAARRRRPPAAG